MTNNIGIFLKSSEHNLNFLNLRFYIAIHLKKSSFFLITVSITEKKYITLFVNY